MIEWWKMVGEVIIKEPVLFFGEKELCLGRLGIQELFNPPHTAARTPYLLRNKINL